MITTEVTSPITAVANNAIRAMITTSELSSLSASVENIIASYVAVMQKSCNDIQEYSYYSSYKKFQLNTYDKKSTTACKS